MKIGMQLRYGNALGYFIAFSQIFHFRRFFAVFHKKTWFYLDPHNLKTLSRTSMNIGMQLHYGNVLGYVKAFSQIFDFRQFLPFFIEKHSFL